MLMSLTVRQLNRATLDRQLLLRRERLGVADVVRRVVALQAQEPASPYLALWNRVARFDPAELDKAFADRVVVKATLVRITLHAAHVEDYPELHQAMLPLLRDSRLTDSRFTSTGLSVADVDALLAPLTRFTARPRTGAEIEAMLAKRSGAPGRGVWWAMRTFAPLHYVPVGGPWSFQGSASFVAAGSKSARANHRESVQRLVRRYLEAFGPATAQDIGQFTFHRQPAVRQALGALEHRLERLEGPSGTTLFDVPGAPRPAEDLVAPPRLLPMWDNILLAYADRSRIVPPDYRPLIFRRNGNVLPTLLVDGYVAGVWRPIKAGIEATAFHSLDDATWDGLAAEAGQLVAFLADRDPAVYRRYHRWWTQEMPRAEVRVLPG